ncbi:MAG: nucleoside phosphorylase [Bacteroidales bacterium]
MNTKIEASELLINTDGSVYHLQLQPSQLADLCFLVGDPNRVPKISQYFESIELKVENRELHTHTGYYKGKRVSVISTGMGCDNLDIVMNELDALCNIDLKTREIKKQKRSLQLIRLGTCGALHKEQEVESFCTSAYALGLDGLLNYYVHHSSEKENAILETFLKQINYPANLAKPYVVEASDYLLNKFAFDMKQGITATAFGFFGPQGRKLRLELQYPQQTQDLSAFSYQGNQVLNYEMETAALYGLGKALGHQCLSISVVVANRESHTFSLQEEAMQTLIKTCLERI